jgi:hypothetical protein
MSRILAHIDRRLWRALVGWTVVVFVVAELLYVLPLGSHQRLLFFKDSAEAVKCIPPPSLAQLMQARAWLLTILACAALAGAIASRSLLIIIGLWKSGNRETRRYRMSAILWRVVFFAVFLLWISPYPPHLSGPCASSFRMYYSPTPLYPALAFCMSAIWALEQRVLELDCASGSIDTLTAYIDFRARLQSLFSLASLILVFAVTQIAQRQSLQTALSPIPAAIPKTAWLEGLSYTLLLACAYIPIHATFNRVGDHLLHAICQDPPCTEAKTLKEWTENRKSLQELLSLGSFEWKAFGPGVAVIAPALAGFVAKLIESAVLAKP